MAPVMKQISLATQISATETTISTIIPHWGARPGLRDLMIEQMNAVLETLRRLQKVEADGAKHLKRGDAATQGAAR